MTVLAARYELLEKVGEGGMSVVWLARDRKLERDVAIKQLRSFVAGDPAQSRRFHREARALAALAHEHIVRIYDYVSSEEHSFLVMEYVAGENLAQATRGRLPLALPEAAAYVKPVAEALAYAHTRGVVHRDLTPSNILVERSSARVVTTDFGIARIARSSGSLTATGVLLGTPEYWSPELALGRESGTAADVYALGCILFLLSSGRLPFEGEDRLAVGLRRAHEDAPSLRTLVPDAPESAIALVDSLLARDVESRPDASVVAARLDELAAGVIARPAALETAPDSEPRTIAVPSEQPTTQLPAPPTIAVARPSRRRWVRRRVLAAVLASIAVIVGALVFAGEVRNPLLRVPNVVSLREDVARAQIQRSLPTATVTVQRVYSTRIGAGRVIRQRPEPSARYGFGTRVQLLVSKGTPFAPVPALAGRPAARAQAALARQGFASRYEYEPSWTVRKGAVVGLQPHAGTRLHRPARVTIVVATGYPRAVVPDVRDAELASAQQQLATNHLRYRLVWRLTDDAPPGQVLDQIPAAGTTVYQGAQIRLTVARTLHWVKLFAVSGADEYESDVFTVPARWRIRYRLAANDFGLALAQIAWTGTDEFGGHSFVASSAGALRTYVSSDGAGSYRLSVRPFADTRWYVEVDALK
ncbi:MAG: protein kinase domain-containing protein [Gaiellaceae bacterium]